MCWRSALEPGPSPVAELAPVALPFPAPRPRQFPAVSELKHFHCAAQSPVKVTTQEIQYWNCKVWKQWHNLQVIYMDIFPIWLPCPHMSVWQNIAVHTTRIITVNQWQKTICRSHNWAWPVSSSYSGFMSETDSFKIQHRVCVTQLLLEWLHNVNPVYTCGVQWIL